MCVKFTSVAESQNPLWQRNPNTFQKEGVSFYVNPYAREKFRWAESIDPGKICRRKTARSHAAKIIIKRERKKAHPKENVNGCKRKPETENSPAGSKDST